MHVDNRLYVAYVVATSKTLEECCSSLLLLKYCLLILDTKTVQKIFQFPTGQKVYKTPIQWLAAHQRESLPV